MAANQVIGGSGLTSNPGLIDRERNDQLLQQALENAQREKEFQARYALEQQQMALAQQENARQQAQLDYQNQRADREFEYQAKRDTLGDALAREQMRYDSEYKNAGLSNALKLAEMKYSQQDAITPYQQEMIDLKRSQLGNESITMQKARNKDVGEVTQALSRSARTSDSINAAMSAIKDLPGGLFGKVKIATLEQVDPNNPILGKWQTIKSVLGDAQLLQTAKTKGAISDREMAQFQKMVANDDINSLPKIKSALERLASFADFDAQATTEAYRMNYGNDALEKLYGEYKNRQQYAPPSARGSLLGDALQTRSLSSMSTEELQAMLSSM